jgi:hypothetical protein
MNAEKSVEDPDQGDLVLPPAQIEFGQSNMHDSGEDPGTVSASGLYIEENSSMITRESSYNTKDQEEKNDKQSFIRKLSFAASLNNHIVLSSRRDWYGNTCLHQLFATYEVNFKLVQKVIEEFPNFISCQNQFGKLPLHYAVDRSKVNIKGLELLLLYYPLGAEIRDNEGQSPYDIARKWDHSRTVLLSLLNACPGLDRDGYLKLKYGPLGSLAVWAASFSGKSGQPYNAVVVQTSDNLSEGDSFPASDLSEPAVLPSSPVPEITVFSTFTRSLSRNSTSGSSIHCSETEPL